MPSTCSTRCCPSPYLPLVLAALLGSGCGGGGGGGSLSTPSPSTTPPGGGTTTNYTLSVNKSGTGSGLVSSSPSGINCGTICSASFVHGTTVTLTAVPSAGSSFSGWSGACSGAAAQCFITMDGNRSVTASFSPAQTSYTATLSWNAPNTNTDGSCLNDLFGYTLYYGIASGSYGFSQNLATSSVSCSNTPDSNACGTIQRCSYTLQGLSAGTWYFAVAAYNMSGVYSALSNEASKTLP